MAKYKFMRNYHDHRKGEIVEGMQFDSKTVMVRNPHTTGYTSTLEPMFLGSQRLLIKVK